MDNPGPPALPTPSRPAGPELLKEIFRAGPGIPPIGPRLAECS
jgi:hypothetical protein